jgi:hypothetical protein
VFYVKEVNIVARNKREMDGALRLIVYILIFSGPIYITAVDITLGL